MLCNKCDSAKSYEISGVYNLIIAPPLGHSYNKLIKALQEKNFNPTISNKSVIELKISAEQLPVLGKLINECYSFIEQEDSRAILISAQNERYNLEDLVTHTNSLKKMVGLFLSQWVVNLIKNKMLTTYCQPIIDANTLKPYGFECLLRGKVDNEIIMPTDIFNAAKSSDLLFLLDKTARITHIENMKKVNIQNHKVFINFNPTSIYDPLFCLKTTNKKIQESLLKPEQIVFEVIESDEVKEKKHLFKIMDYYKNQGYGVALDDLGSGYSSLNLLTELRPNYIKLDKELVTNIHENEFKQVILEKICEMAYKLGILTVCEGIETQDELNFVKQFHVDLFQGFLFGRPKPYNEILD